MLRPAIAEVGPYKYKIHFDKDMLNRASVDVQETLEGITVHREEIIVVDPNLSSNAEREVILHELLHAIFNMGETDLDHDHEEKVVRYLAFGLLDFMRRNPSIIEYLIDG